MLGIFILVFLGIYLLTTILEWLVMLIMKYGSPGTALWDCLQVNGVSFVVGCIFLSFEIDITNGPEVLIGFATAVLAEGLLLQLLKKNISAKKVWRICIVMNAVTYFLFWLI